MPVMCECGRMAEVPDSSLSMSASVPPTVEEIMELVSTFGLLSYTSSGEGAESRAFDAIKSALTAALAPSQPEPAATQEPTGETSVLMGRREAYLRLERKVTEWNDATGALPRGGSWFWEVLSMVQDAYVEGRAALSPSASAETAATPAWIPVSERLPEQDVPVLAFAGNRTVAVLTKKPPHQPGFFGWQRHPFGPFDVWLEVSHWAPLIPAPALDEGVEHG